MASRPKYSEAKILENYRISLENAENQPMIAAVMAEHGFDTEEIAKGKTLLEKTRTAFSSNKHDDNERSQAYSAFIANKKELSETYKLHRKKAKIIFRKDPETLKKLNLDGKIPQAYVKWLEVVKKLYREVLNDKAIQQKLLRLKITADELSNANKKITELEEAKAKHIREKGEAQKATKDKDAAFVIMSDYMSEFYAVSRIALKDNRQLLESLGILVKN
jgi:hypothetical protein